MTDQEWQTSEDSEQMIFFVRDRASARKMRLLTLGGCSRVRHVLSDQSSQSLLAIAGRYAEGLCDQSDLAPMIGAISQVTSDLYNSCMVGGRILPEKAKEGALFWAYCSLMKAAQPDQSRRSHLS